MEEKNAAAATGVEELSGSIATDEKDLKAAAQIGEKEAADVAVSQEELMADVDTLDQAIEVLDKEFNQGGAHALWASIDTSNNKVQGKLGLNGKGLQQSNAKQRKLCW